MPRNRPAMSRYDARIAQLMRPGFLTLLSVTLLLLLVGCSASPSDEVAGDWPGPEDSPSPKEYWDVIYIDGAKIGHGHTTITPFVEDGKRLLRIENELEMTTKRFGQAATTMRLTLASVETPSGEVVRFRSEHPAGPAVSSSSGRCESDRVVIETSSLRKTQQSSINWDRSWGGFFALDGSMMRQPMTPGEKRTVRCLVPILNEVCDVQLKAMDYEETQLLDDVRKLLKVHVHFPLSSATLEETRWVDQSGETIKTLTPNLQQVSYRTVKEIALRKNDDFDLGEFSVVKVDRPIPRPHATRRIVYQARLNGGDPSDRFSIGPTQSVRPIDQETILLTVQSIRPDRPKELERAEEPPTSDDLHANNLIQSDDPRIREMANQVASKESDHWIIATQLEKHVDRTIAKKSFSQAFATAAEVVETKEGDCTEHAVLLAALCRARGIAARVAIGLVYVPRRDGNAFAYHMWNEVWIKDRWVPLDATLGQGGIGAAHVKLTHSNLKGSSAYSAFLPVMQVIRRLELEVVEME